MMEIFHQLTLLIAVRCSDSFFVHNREGDDKMSVENEKMQTDVRYENVVFVSLLILSFS
jgi:hypothetical protein